MLELIHEATVKSISLRKEYHGDEHVKAVTVKLHFEAVPLQVVRDGFVSQLDLIYKDKEPQLTELKGLQVSRSVENVEAHISAVKFIADVESIELLPLAGEVIDVTLVLKGQCPKGATDKLHDALHEIVNVSLAERQHGIGDVDLDLTPGVEGEDQVDLDVGEPV